MTRPAGLAILVLLALNACGTVAQETARIEALHAQLLQDVEEPDVGMQAYALAVLRRGPEWSAEQTAATRELQAAHRAHIDALAASGELVLAGPCGPQSTEDPYVGFFLFDCEMDRALELAEADPAVTAGRLRVELVPWWAPEGIGFGVE